jgi:hypothetical protein
MDNLSNTFKDASANIVPSSESLLETSSGLTIVAFLLLVIVACILIFSFGSSLIYYFMKAPSKLYLVNGMVPGSQQKIVYQNPAQSNAATIYRSVNESKGIEFTWSLWMNINSINFNQNVYSPIFYKGNNNLNSVGLNYPANAPGLYLEPMKNNLLLIMNTFKEINEEYGLINNYKNTYNFLKPAAYIFFIILIFIIGNFSANTFIYFQF